VYGPCFSGMPQHPETPGHSIPLKDGFWHSRVRRLSWHTETSILSFVMVPLHPVEKKPEFRQHRLNNSPLPHGHGSLRPSFSFSSLSPWTTLRPRLTWASLRVASTPLGHERNSEKGGVTNLTVILGDATQPHVPEASIDVAFLCTALGEIPDRSAALAQCYRALKTGGRLSVTELILDPHYQRRSTVRRLAEAAGFRLVSIQGGWWFYTASFVKA
jgi:SAM-dependent methyltransferase